MKRKWIIVTAVMAVVVAICAISAVIIMRKGEIEVEMELKWALSEGKYIPMNVSVGDVVYGDGGVEVKITELGEEMREGDEPNIVIRRTARGVVLRGAEMVREGMELHVLRGDFVAIPEICIPEIRVLRTVKR